jgi:hypothetical protein
MKRRPRPSLSSVVWNNSTEWNFEPEVTPSAPRVRRSAATAAATLDSVPAEFLTSDRVVVEKTFVVSPVAPARRSTAVPVIDLEVATAPGESSVLAVRHASGALTFHAPQQRTVFRRGTAVDGPVIVRFVVPLRSTPEAAARRGAIGAIVKKAVKVIVIKIVNVVIDAVLPVLAKRWEENAWKKKKLTEGWLRVTRESLGARRLVPLRPEAAELRAGRSLLFIHGTFSNAARTFAELAAGDFFERIKPLYGDRVYAFDHFSVSRTPEENARMLVEALPAGRFEFDAITHSRGGLVLRNLAERASALGAAGSRFALGHAVLVASPNEGTPLATPDRWERTVGWFANLLELFPENPFTLGPEWIAEALVWIATRASGGLPGIGAMDGAGELIGALQEPPPPALDAYSALASNFTSDNALWARMLDVGVDGFFDSPNDLVVPTEGGWRVDKVGFAFIPGDRIGCFGPGGNLLQADPDAVNHINFFKRKETVDFIADTLSRGTHSLAPIDAQRPLPGRRFVRSASGAALALPALAPAAAPPAVLTATAEPTRKIAAPVVIHSPEMPLDTFHLIVLPPTREGEPSQILATYGSARVVERFVTKGEADNAGRRFQKVIGMQQRIRGYIDGKEGCTLPTDQELLDYGILLFDTLFPGDVRRLYDTARSMRGNRRLDLIFTSMISWIADKPWEFAHDPSRRSFLATEELNFVRNVLTAVPAQEIEPRPAPLRILVVVAQPIGTAQLSHGEETAVIRRGFEPLIEVGLADVDVLTRATPDSLHDALDSAEGRPLDIVHFIGHGEFDDAQHKGFLLFEDGQGAPHRADDRNIREILCQRGVRLIFLNACETGRGGRADFNRGVAPALVAGGVPAVVANQFKVLDPSATAFAQRFYWSLAEGRSIGDAARESRIAVNYSISGETIDWAVPVVYARDPHLRLCAGLGAGRKAPSGAARTATARRRAIEQHAIKVAVWDVQHAFPDLEKTLARLNAAQSRFGFELVDLSAPIGTWQGKSARKGETGTFLHADHVAQRLKNKPRELGVNYLFCITNQPMASGGIENLYGWWEISEDGSPPPVMLFSTAGFSIEPRGLETKRVLANALVQCLTGQLVQYEAHERGPKTCPLFYNPDRRLELLANRQKFDAKCAAYLRRRIPDDLPALNRLLAVFHEPDPSSDR